MLRKENRMLVVHPLFVVLPTRTLYSSRLVFSTTCDFKNRSIHVRKTHLLVSAAEIECALLKYSRCPIFLY